MDKHLGGKVKGRWRSVYSVSRVRKLHPQQHSRLETGQNSQCPEFMPTMLKDVSNGGGYLSLKSGWRPRQLSHVPYALFSC